MEAGSIDAFLDFFGPSRQVEAAQQRTTRSATRTKELVQRCVFGSGRHGRTSANPMRVTSVDGDNMVAIEFHNPHLTL